MGLVLFFFIMFAWFSNTERVPAEESPRAESMIATKCLDSPEDQITDRELTELRALLSTGATLKLFEVANTRVTEDRDPRFPDIAACLAPLAYQLALREFRAHGRHSGFDDTGMDAAERIGMSPRAAHEDFCNALTGEEIGRCFDDYRAAEASASAD
jgi:hypothetical protein